MPEYKRKYTRKKEDETPTDANGRLMPQALDFENAVIGALLIEQEAFSLVSELLTPDSFYDERNKLIYQAIVALKSEQQPVDLLTVTEKLRATGNLDAAGGAYHLASLSEDMASSAHIEYHAKIVAQKALSRQLIHFCARTQRGAFDETQDIDDLMQEAESSLYELSMKNKHQDFQNLDNVMIDAMELLKKRAGQAGGLSGLPSGFHEIDAITSGWQNSNLIIIAARPAMGKTAFVLSMAANMAIEQHIPVALFSLEMENLELVNRLISNVCEIDSGKLRSGQLEPYEWQQLDVRMNKMFQAPLYLDETSNMSISELRTKARRLVSEYGVRLIIIDYLQLMNASGMNVHNRQEEVSYISRSLKVLAKELKIPIIVLSQLNRDVEKRTGAEGKKPQLSDLRESGAIEQDADIVCFIHRPEVFRLEVDDSGEDMTGKGLFIIAKHRNGKLGEIKLRFRGEYTRFANLDDDRGTMAFESMPRRSRMNRDSHMDDSMPFPPPDDPLPDPTVVFR